MFDDEKEREDKDDLDVEPEEVEDLEASEEDKDVSGGRMMEEKAGITCCSAGSHCSRC
jgi:hypothetical protein